MLAFHSNGCLFKFKITSLKFYETFNISIFGKANEEVLGSKA